MNKGFLDDTFEKAVEAGQSMTKAGAKQIKQTFNPLQMVRNVALKETQKPDETLQKQAESLGKDKKGSTPLDFEKLQKSYEGQDDLKAKAVANRLFHLVKTGEEKVYREKKQKEEEKKRQELYTQEEEKRKKAEKVQAQQSVEEPHGKERKSIFGSKKKKSAASPAPTEMKPSKGKQ